MNGSLLYKKQQEENSRNAARASQSLPARHSGKDSTDNTRTCLNSQEQEARVGLLPASEQLREGITGGPRDPPKAEHQQTTRLAPSLLNEVDQPRDVFATQ